MVPDIRRMLETAGVSQLPYQEIHGPEQASAACSRWPLFNATRGSLMKQRTAPEASDSGQDNNHYDDQGW
ncbi:MAG: hypothetical protein ACI9WU_000887 [Myxococcota bacterium]|jgi:hypothetical protein